jgi:L-iditol 2-dehydrogenase
VVHVVDGRGELMTGFVSLAAVLTEPGRIEVQERPIPEPGSHEVVVSVSAVGVCGSDVHYFEHGRIGDFVVEHPLVLGHEASGTVVARGAGVATVSVGQRVSIEPGWPDGTCAECRAGRYNLCPDVRFLATPPYDGAFATMLCVPGDFAHPVADHVSDDAAALVEPLAVAVATCRRAGVVAGSSVVVMGGGPIGVMCAEVAIASGATRVAVVEPNELRRRRGSSVTGATFHDAGAALDGGFDVFLECSGAAPALRQGIDLLRPAGRAVLVGMGADEVLLPVSAMQTKELWVTGCFRYANAYPEAIALVAAGRIDLDLFVDRYYGLADVHEALTATRRDPSILKAVVRPGQ